MTKLRHCFHTPSAVLLFSVSHESSVLFLPTELSVYIVLILSFHLVFALWIQYNNVWGGCVAMPSIILAVIILSILGHHFPLRVFLARQKEVL